MRRRDFLAASVGGGVGLGVAASWPGRSASARVGAPAAPRLAKTMAAGEPAIIYSVRQQRVWVVTGNFALLKTHLVSGRFGNPPPGNYRVFSKSPKSFSTHNPAVQWNYMVRFYVTPRGANIGFHQIPVRCKNGSCTPLQSTGQLGTPRSSGCVRQKASDAKWIYGWAKIGTLVVVIP